MIFLTSQKPKHSVFWQAVLLSVLVSGLLIAADQLSIRFGLHGWQRVVDDLLGGLIAGLIFNLYEKRRLRRFNEHLHVIDLMNQHIRNAMQPLMFVTFEPGARAQMELVEECMRHIDWALREVLPGNSEQELVVHDGGLAGSRLRITSPASTSPEARNSQPQPRSLKPNTFLGQWLDTWRSRNLGARQ
ncbi:MAG: hypothetical protein WB660_16350 [Candidatus Sulfotelmatobacter sp.]